MITFIITVSGLVVIAGFLHSAFDKESRTSIDFPDLLTDAELWRNGTKLMYFRNGEWCEALARTKDKVYIFDSTHNWIVGVSLIK